jgi:hypothetical protein
VIAGTLSQANSQPSKLSAKQTLSQANSQPNKEPFSTKQEDYSALNESVCTSRVRSRCSASEMKEPILVPLLCNDPRSTALQIVLDSIKSDKLNILVAANLNVNI